MPPSLPRLTGTYPKILDAAWAEHEATRATDAPTVISTFAGTGGSSLGYSMAGYRELLAVEWDDNAAENFRLNFPDVPLHHGDIGGLSVEEVLKRTGLEPRQLDVFDGSPPCQGFSTAGKRMIDDPRNGLFREYVRLLRGLKPRAFVMENVSGMVKGKMKLVFVEILRELKASGYRVSARLLNAAYFQVPQARERMIFIGVREDLGIDPSHPRPLSSMIALRDVLPGFMATRSQRINPWIGADRPVATLCKAHAGNQALVSHPDPPNLTPKYRQLAPRIRPGECAADHDPGKGFQNLVRVRLDRPSPTLTKMNPGNGRGTPLHPVLHRSLNIHEAKRIGAFPDQFRLTGPFAEQWARIGNSVPPLLMRAIAGHIRFEILGRCLGAISFS